MHHRNLLERSLQLRGCAEGRVGNVIGFCCFRFNLFPLAERLTEKLEVLRKVTHFMATLDSANVLKFRCRK